MALARGAAAAALVPELLPTLRAFAIPMPTRFRGTTVREGALLAGPAGWGEFSPFPEYGPRECARWLACAIEAATSGWPAPVRDRVPVNVTVPAVGPRQAHDIVARSGCRTAKVKVAEPGQPWSDDAERVEAVRDAIGADGKVRIDANGGWRVDEATAALTTLSRFGLEYAEQPCATLDELAVDPTHAWIIGDNFEADIRPARPLGMRSCWLTPPEKIAPTDGAFDARIARLTDLPEVLRTCTA